jgi:N-acetylglutamate synthase
MDEIHGVTCRLLEEAIANMLPASQSTLYDGWQLRMTPGTSRNPNSVWPLYSGRASIESKIDFCERQYRDQGLSCSFRLSEGDDHEAIQDRLTHRGYTVHNPNRVLVTATFPTDAVDIVDVTLDEWLRTALELDSDLNEEAIRLKQGPLARISLPTWYGLIAHDGMPCSYGRAIQQDNLFQLAELWTSPRVRGKGHGTRLIQGLMRIGNQAGARTAFLPVSESNEGAWRLYDRLGFKSVYGYRYLIPPK